MSIFSAFQSLWSSSCDASTPCAPTGPLVNIDGTPMLNDSVDIHGHPYGVVDMVVTDLHTGLDTGRLDCSMDGGSDFGTGCWVGSSDW